MASSFFSCTPIFVYLFFSILCALWLFFHIFFCLHSFVRSVVRAIELRCVYVYVCEWVSVDVFHLVCWWMIVISVVWRQTRAQHSLCSERADWYDAAACVHFYSNNAFFHRFFLSFLFRVARALSRFFPSCVAFCLYHPLFLSMRYCLITFFRIR